MKNLIYTSLIVQTVMLFFIGLSFWIIYSFIKEKKFNYLALAYNILALKSLSNIIHFLISDFSYFYFVSVISTLAFIYFIIKGTTDLKSKKYNTMFFSIATLTLVLMFLVIVLIRVQEVEMLLGFIIMGLGYILTGILSFVYDYSLKSKRYIILTLYAVWGGLTLLLSVFYQNVIFVSLSYLLIIAIQTTIAIIILLLLLNTVKSEINRNKKKYEIIFNSASDAMLLLKGNVIKESNTAALNMFKYSKENFIGKNPELLSPPYQSNGKNSITAGKKILEKTNTSDSQFFEWQHKDSQGYIIDTEISLSRIEIYNEPYLLAIIRDITKVKETKDLIEITDKIFSKSFEALAITDPKGVMLEINKAFTSITGYTKEESIGKNVDIIRSGKQNIEARKATLEQLRLTGE